MTSKFRITINSDSFSESFGIEGESFFIGRSDQADITVKNALFSRKHIKIQFNQETLSIQDLETTNGTKLNDKKLEAQKWYDFVAEDSITVGEGQISIKIEVLEEIEKSKIIDLAEFYREKEVISQESIASKKQSYNKPATRDETVVATVGNLALKSDPFVPQVEQLSQHDEFQQILNRVDESPQSEFSEIELLEIKKIEIESQVKALKIKEESEQEALRILERAKAEANSIINDAHEKSVGILDLAEDQSEDLLAKSKESSDELLKKVQADSETRLSQAKDESERILLKASQESETSLGHAKMESEKLLTESKAYCDEQNSELETKVSDLKLDIDYLRKEKTDLSNKIEKVNDDISDSLKQKQNLELRCDSLRDKNTLLEKELDGTEQKSQQLKDSLYDKEDRLNGLKSELSGLETQKVSLESTKQTLDSSIEELKQRESQIQVSIEKNQERIDKFFDIKEEISNENKKIEGRLKGLKESELEVTHKIDQMNEALTQKKGELIEIETTAKTHFQEEQIRLQNELDLKQQKQEAYLENTKRESQAQSEKIISQAQVRAQKLEQDSTNLFNKAKQAEEKSSKIEAQSRDEAQVRADKQKIELLEKLQDANTEVKEMQQKSLSEYQSTLMTAKEKGMELLDAAQKSAEDKIQAANVEAKEMFQASRKELEMAQSKAVELVRLAQDKSAQVHADALKGLEGVKTKLSNENDVLKKTNSELLSKSSTLKVEIDGFQTNLDKRKHELAESMKAQKDELVKEAHDAAKDLKEKAYSELHNIQEKISQLEANQMKEVEKAIAEKQQAEKMKFDKELAQEKDLLSQFRDKEVQKLKNMQAKEDAKIEGRKKEYLKVITAGVVNVVNIKIKDLIKKKILPAEAKVDEEGLTNLLKAALMDEAPEKNQLLSQLKSSGVKNIGKSAKQTKKAAIIAGVVILLMIVALVFRKPLGSLFSSVGSAVSIDQSAKDLYLTDLDEREKNKPKFLPKMSDAYQNRYVDNIIYTKRFMEIFPSDEFQKKWIIQLEIIMTQKLGLNDFKIVPYISEELKMVNGIVNIRKKIRLETKTIRISEMRAIEDKSRKKLVKILGSKDKFNRMQEFTKKFFIEYKQKFK